MIASRKTAIPLFTISAACVYTTIYFITRGTAGVGHPGRLAVAALCDLLITVPVLFYWLLVRGGFANLVTLVGVALAGLRAAWLLLPATMHGYLPGLAWMAVPFELWVLAMLVRRRSALQNSLPLRLARGEWEVFHLALFSFRARPDERSGYRACTYAEASGYAMFTMLLLLILPLEAIPLHLVVHRWNPRIAWILTALDGYALLWAVAVARSLRLRPMLFGVDTILLRAGMLWRVEFSRALIAKVWRVSGNAPNRREPGYLRLTVINDPQWVIELSEPVIAHGPFGLHRMVNRIGFALDDPNPPF